MKINQPALNGYGPPTKRSRFAVGDIVTVYIPDRGQSYSPQDYFRVYHPKYALPYIGMVGVIHSYKSTGQQTRYAVTFDDGLTLSFEAGFLLGPFSSREAAEKYSRVDGVFRGEVDVKDLKGYANNAVEVDGDLEKKLKEAFCNEEMGFTWLDKELSVKYEKFKLYVLAYKKNASSMKRDGRANMLDFANRINQEEGGELDFLNDCFVIFKSVDPVTNKLIKTSSVMSGAAPSATSPYYILQPAIQGLNSSSSGDFDNGKILDPADMFWFAVTAISAKTIEKVLRAFKRFKTGFKDGFEVFQEQYGLKDGQPPVIMSRSNVFIDENVLGPRMNEIVNYTIKCKDCTITFKNSSNRISYLPKEINSEGVTFYFNQFEDLVGLDKCKFSNLQDLKMYKDLGSLKGLSSDINKSNVHLHLRQLNNFIGAPSEINCSLDITKVNSFKGADSCIVNNWVSAMESPTTLDGFFKEVKEFRSWSVSKEEVERYKMYRVVGERLPELEGMF